MKHEGNSRMPAKSPANQTGPATKTKRKRKAPNPKRHSPNPNAIECRPFPNLQSPLAPTRNPNLYGQTSVRPRIPAFFRTPAEAGKLHHLRRRSRRAP
ncbi:hypothetical protein C2L65_28965 [Paraburkholderia terrae]|uniref:Uncharacterized protein n=1 Tax=Paraburkholderia terrae TaxID=311230 RepID=A0A2I8EVD5_9BURK|nr:hypothetical protein C2L65_28965 [Paraburkholderia terrae]